MKRLFVFGCSYTAYSWPTWADFLSIHFDEYQNWGMAGIGNRAIMERIAECNIKNKFNENDTVIVQWSTHLRNDFFHQEGLLTDRVPGWKTSGSIFNYLNSRIYDEKWLKTFFDEEAYFMHTLNNISLTQSLLKNTKATWYMTSIGEIRELGEDLPNIKVYGERSIFSDFVDLFKKINKKYLGYRITPQLEVYDSIWNEHKDRWLPPIWSSQTRGALDDIDPNLFYIFNDETGGFFADNHLRADIHVRWLKSYLLDKLKIAPKNEIYQKICDQVEELRIKNLNNSKRDFEKALFKTEFDLPKWPNMIRGFHFFEKDL